MPFASLASWFNAVASPVVAGMLAAAPWWALPPLLALRLRQTPSLDDVDAGLELLSSTPRVSLILPARNEALHIGDCLRAIRRSTWPDLEILVIDDGSTDATASIARQVAEGDRRVRVIQAPPLPDGWFGKQWACHVGTRKATGSLLLFTDADTRHAPDLVLRMVLMRASRGADLLSVAGRQETGTVWERAVQPLMFALILARYGGASALERARHASDVVANGQCFMISRTSYDAVGGHEAVRDFVAEDVMMAQAVWQHGGRVSMALGRVQLSTRMYDSLSSLVRGWAKNVYAGGRHSMRGGRVGRALFPALLLSAPLFVLVPPFALLGLLIARVLAMMDGSPVIPWWDAWLVWSAVATASVLLTVGTINRFNGEPWHRALLAPLGAAVMLAIFARAIARGSAVEWKDRGYVAR
jgi:chlorobactene glucosyltransferase